MSSDIWVTDAGISIAWCEKTQRYYIIPEIELEDDDD